MGVDAKHQKNGKKSFQNQFVFSHRFLKDFGANLGGFWDPSWAPTNMFPEAFSQDASKRRPRGFQEPQERPKSGSRAPQEPPRASQERPRVTKTCPGNAHGAIRGVLFDAFLRFSMFFCVFPRVSAFFCDFLRFLRFSTFLCAFLRNCSTLIRVTVPPSAH